MITIDEIRITEAMKEVLKEWQNEEYTFLDCDIEAIENAICFIACEHECPLGDNDKEALMIIASLGDVRKKLKKFTGKEHNTLTKPRY